MSQATPLNDKIHFCYYVVALIDVLGQCEKLRKCEGKFDGREPIVDHGRRTATGRLGVPVGIARRSFSLWDTLRRQVAPPRLDRHSTASVRLPIE